VSEELVGKLLVATPLLQDPNFWRSVVLVCQQNEDGFLGLILNRPLEAEVAEHLPDWQHLASAPPRIFEGGPVQREVAIGLARHAPGDPGEGWTAVDGDLGLLDLSGDPADQWGDLQELRVYSGYAGWAAGQLEGEIEEQAWFVVDAEPGDPFCEECERLWQRVLRRQPGRLAMFATFPPDPAMN
jgi:putative transcriptional regulator